MHETTILQEGLGRLTNRRTLIGTQTYSMSGVLLPRIFNWGIVLNVIGLVLVALAKPSYVIQVRSATGISNILGSTDTRFIQRIVEAMNKAIRSKGSAA